MFELLSFVNFDSTYIKIITAVSAVAAILGYIGLRKYLKLPQTNFTKHTKQWCLEGVAMERITLLILIKDVLNCILGVLYIFCTLFVVLASFYPFIDFGVNETSFKIWAVAFFILPIVIRIAFELVHIFIYKCLKYVIKAIIFIAKLAWKIICGIARFIWNFCATTAHLIVDFVKWLDAMLTNNIEKNNKQQQEIKNGNAIFYNPKFYTKAQLEK